MQELKDENDNPSGSKNGNCGGHTREKGFEHLTDMRMLTFAGAADGVG